MECIVVSCSPLLKSVTLRSNATPLARSQCHQVSQVLRPSTKDLWGPQEYHLFIQDTADRFPSMTLGFPDEDVRFIRDSVLCVLCVPCAVFSSTAGYTHGTFHGVG